MTSASQKTQTVHTQPNPKESYSAQSKPSRDNDAKDQVGNNRVKDEPIASGNVSGRTGSMDNEGSLSPISNTN